MSSPAPLSPPFSLYLDLVRFAAAVMVVLAHVEYFGLVQAGAWGLLTTVGRESVIVFFVLSGFVIATTVTGRRPDGRAYAVARLSRLYSVALPVLLLALAAALGMRALSVPLPRNAYMLDKLHLYLPLHLLFLGEHWTLNETPPLMLPYWSLSYEAWYYLLFGLVFFLRGWRRSLLVVLTLAVMGYKLWLLLPVWLSGVWLCTAYRGPWMSRGAARAGWAASLLLFCAWIVLRWEAPLRAAAIAWWPFPALPLGSADRFLGDYVVAAIVLAHFACARDAGLGGMRQAAPLIRALAGYTFTLYLWHAVVFGLWLAFYPHRTGSAADLLALGAVTVASTVALGALTEHRRDRYRAWFGRLLAPRFGAGKGAAPAEPPRA